MSRQDMDRLLTASCLKPSWVLGAYNLADQQRQKLKYVSMGSFYITLGIGRRSLHGSRWFQKPKERSVEHQGEYRWSRLKQWCRRQMSYNGGYDQKEPDERPRTVSIRPGGA
jgi:hypothetical protein